MKDFMAQYKFQGDYRLHRVFQDEFTQTVQKLKPTLVVPIPATEHTMLTRGFNQATELYAGELTNLLAHAHHDKTPQSAKDRQERLATPQPFVLEESSPLVGQRIVLIDDIYTTGRTLYHAAELLRNQGCQEIVSVTLAS